MFVTNNTGWCAKEPVGYVRNEPDSLLITETIEVILVSTGEELDANYVLSGLVGTFQFPVYWWGIPTSGFNNDIIINT